MEDNESTNVFVKQGKKRKLVVEDLQGLSREELIDRIQQLESHNLQLKNIIEKSRHKSEVKSEDSSRRKFDFSKCTKRHVLLKLLYLGWDHQGYVTQEDTTNTIEHYLFTALVRCCLIESRETSKYYRCGRTDKGVSAFSQVVSLDIRSKLTQEQLSVDGDTSEGELDYAKVLNRVLPTDIRVLAWCPAPADYSARFNCDCRTYKYFFPRGNLNIEAMDKAVQHVVGYHDFRNLCKMDVGGGVVNYDRKILSAKVKVISTDTLHDVEHPSAYDMCELTLIGKAYLWHQVRCIMGILFLVGEGKEDVDVMKELLDIKNHPRKPQYNMASHIPLNLFHCEFDCNKWVIKTDEVLGVIRTLQQEWTVTNVKSTMLRTMLSECQHMISDGCEIKDQNICLLQGVRSKVYKPLFERPTCSTLEDRIEHYAKKQKLQVVSPKVIPSETRQEGSIDVEGYLDLISYSYRVNTACLNVINRLATRSQLR